MNKHTRKKKPYTNTSTLLAILVITLLSAPNILYAAFYYYKLTPNPQTTSLYHRDKNDLNVPNDKNCWFSYDEMNKLICTTPISQPLIIDWNESYQIGIYTHTKCTQKNNISSEEACTKTDPHDPCPITMNCTCLNCETSK